MSVIDPINPNSVYTVEQAAKLLQTEKHTLYKAIRGDQLVAKEIGKGIKIVGANLLQYAGSVTYSKPAAPMSAAGAAVENQTR